MTQLTIHTGETLASFILKQMVAQIDSGMFDRSIVVQSVVKLSDLSHSDACKHVAASASKYWTTLQSAHKIYETLRKTRSPGEIATAISTGVGIGRRRAQLYAGALAGIPVGHLSRHSPVEYRRVYDRMIDTEPRSAIIDRFVADFNLTRSTATVYYNRCANNTYKRG